VKLKNLTIYALLPVLFAVLFSQCSTASQPLDQPQDSILLSISNYLDWEAENGFSGVVLVKIPGNEPLVRSYGYANEEQQTVNSAQTAFDIGSITKQFTGAAVLKLEMLGKLSVHDSVGDYLPQLAPEKRMITFHQLLTHTSGLPTVIGSGEEVITREDLLNRINETSLVSAPGSSYLYSHAGYTLLGLLIEAVSGTDYENFLQNHLFRPARMRFTGYRMPDWNATVVSHGYRFCDDWGGPMDSGWLEDGPSWHRRASGGMLSTAADLYAWHEALSGNGILDEQAKRKYYTPDPPVMINDQQLAGYGWRNITTARQTNVIAHNGWNGRYYSDFMRYQEENVTIILLSNRFRDGNQSLPFEIARCIFRPGYQPRLAGRRTQCLDSLPDNRLGFLAGKFINILTKGEEKDFQRFTGKCLASHLIEKFGNDTLVNKLRDLRKNTGPLTIKRVRITDNQLMIIDVNQSGNNKEAYIQLFFDKNEDYRIRGFRFETTDVTN
jgi:CubicO group peptidase (beta-lactamase class C family)